MINYYFSQFIKKNSDWTRPERGLSRSVPWGSGPPGANGGTNSIVFEFGPSRPEPCGPCGTVDHPGLDRTVFKTLTVSRDCLKLFEEEKIKLMKVLKNQHVCLTTDTWTSIQNLNYMCLTAHWIDSD
jgi:hypothetical protein